MKRNREASDDEPVRRVEGRQLMENDDDIEEVSEDDDVDEASDDEGTEEVSDDEASGDTEVVNPEVEKWKRHFDLMAAGKL